jgi:hypothetical protein
MPEAAVVGKDADADSPSELDVGISPPVLLLSANLAGETHDDKKLQQACVFNLNQCGLSIGSTKKSHMTIINANEERICQSERLYAIIAGCCSAKINVCNNSHCHKMNKS